MLLNTLRRVARATNFRCANISSRLQSQTSAEASQPVPELTSNLEEQKQLVDIADIERDILQYPDYFNVANLFTIRDLFDARVHYGHKIGSLNEQMAQFVYGNRVGHLIFDLDKTAVLLRDALNFTAHIAFRDGIILFVNRNALNSHIVEKTAMEAGEFSHTRYWRGGIFTNANVYFGAVTRLPDLCIFLNTQNNILAQHVAVREAAKMAIPTIGILDTNCTPDLITYGVPGNDDSPDSIALYCKLFKAAILRGKQKRREFLGENITDVKSSVK